MSDENLRRMIIELANMRRPESRIAAVKGYDGMHRVQVQIPMSGSVKVIRAKGATEEEALRALLEAVKGWGLSR